jgi:hypothetical protein
MNREANGRREILDYPQKGEERTEGLRYIITNTESIIREEPGEDTGLS